MTLNPTLAHLIGGLAGIGALAALAATGTIAGSDALTGITGIVGVLLGTSATAIGAASSSPAPGALPPASPPLTLDSPTFAGPVRVQAPRAEPPPA